MSDITFNCPHCMQNLEAPEDMAGELIDCPSCSTRIAIPARLPIPKTVSPKSFRPRTAVSTSHHPKKGGRSLLRWCWEYLYSPAIHAAAAKGDIPRVQQLLESGVNIDYVDPRSVTPLRMAVARNRVDMVSFLLENGANVEAVDKNGTTSLMSAVIHGHLEVVKTLLAKGASVNVRNFLDGATPLDCADATGNKTMVELLTREGAWRGQQMGPMQTIPSVANRLQPPFPIITCIMGGIILGIVASSKSMESKEPGLWVTLGIVMGLVCGLNVAGFALRTGVKGFLAVVLFFAIMFSTQGIISLFAK